MLTYAAERRLMLESLGNEWNDRQARMSVGKPVGKYTESDVCYFEVDAVFNREPVL